MMSRRRLTSLIRRLQIREYTVVSPEVAGALAGKRPVVALESTIVTHGLPFPQNLELARTVQELCRAQQVTPATIAVIEGKIKIGLDDSELHTLATCNAATKISRRDIVPVMRRQGTGGTTVSSTMLLAHQNNIEIFATGGIGGVHREGQDTLDISADLVELGRTPVTVVCAGVKSILDIPRTLEYLETQGVTVATFGPTRDFPAFFTANSGYQSHENVVSVEEAAELIYLNQTLQIGSGMLIAVPIPATHEAEGVLIESAVTSALAELETANITGNAVTPYILQRVTELTEGASLQANLALVKNNVQVASGIARALAELRARYRDKRSCSTAEVQTQPLIIGAVNVDIVCSCTETEDQGTAGKDLAAGTIYHTLGGVARNVAECVTRCGFQPQFVSVVGQDKMGSMFLEHCKEIDLNTDSVSVCKDRSTPLVSLYLQGGDVVKGVADFSLHSRLSRELVTEEMVVSRPYVLVDCDTPLHTIRHVGELCSKHGVPFILEPTAPNKFADVVKSGLLQHVNMVTPNLAELSVSFEPGTGAGSPAQLPQLNLHHIPSQLHPTVLLTLKYALRCLAQMSACPYTTVLVTLGHVGALHCSFHGEGCLEIQYTAPAPRALMQALHVKSASGAGDSFLGGYLSGMSAGAETTECLQYGAYCAYQSLLTLDTISEDIRGLAGVAEGVRQWRAAAADNWAVRTLYSGRLS